MGERITRVRLYNVPLENDYKQTIYFRNVTAQQEYFNNLPLVKQFTDFNYIRKDSKIRVPSFINPIGHANYVIYENYSGDGIPEKTFYCFITKMEYVDDNRTDIYIETDVMQTYLNQYTIRESFIEREHTDSDYEGNNTIPEQLELGDYVVNKKDNCVATGDYCLIMATTVNLNVDGFPNVAGGYYNGIYSGVKYYYMSATTANNAIKALASAGKSDAIVAIFHAPLYLVEDDIDDTLTYFEIKNSLDAFEDSWSIQRLSTIDGYTPKNKKLLNYPYRYILVTNNAGSSTVLHHELCPSSYCDFNIYSALTIGCSTVLIPKNYGFTGEDTRHALVMGKLPVCSWTNDVYTNWLTQNSINIGTSLATSGLQIVGGIGMMATGLGAIAGAGNVANGFLSVANSVGEIYAHSLQPAVMEGNINSGDVMFSCDNISFTAYQMSIKREYAEIIDNYFQMYGYKVNRVGIPLKNHRQKWWFTKTRGINIDSDTVRIEDIQKIKNIYDNGITFIRYPYTVANYSETNGYVVEG